MTFFRSIDGQRREAFAAIVFVVALIATGLIYRSALGGSFHFDDPHNLGPLSSVVDTGSAFEYIAAGAGGPLGRPLSLALFAIESYAWPHAPEIFLHTNQCLHLLNGALAVWLLFLLAAASGRRRDESTEIAVIGGALWMLLPILASSSLLIVQRMTLLSATFVFGGFIAYLYSRRLLSTRPNLALVTMTSSLAVGTGLAMFAKENGALLPLLVLAAEATVLRSGRDDEPKPAWWTAWRTVFLLAPAAGVFGYLLLRANYSEDVLTVRDFDAGDRLLTEAHVLWEYLRYAFLPTPTGLGPFHDDHSIYRDWLNPQALLVVGAWLASIAGAIALRKRAPLFSFAVAWYLFGHALESTTIPLEIYFEHRNYVPLLGPLYALVASLLSTSPQWRSAIRFGLTAYGAVLGFVLLNVTSLWGQPLLAAEMWVRYQPGSTRAVQYLAEQYERAGDRETTKRVLTSYLKEHPDSPDVPLQLLGVSCFLDPDTPSSDLLETAKRNLAMGEFSHGVHPTLDRLYRIVKDRECAGVDRQDVYDLAALAAENPEYRARPVTLHNLHMLMATEATAQRRLDVTMRHLESALSAHYSLSALEFAVRALNSAGLHEKAKFFLEQARAFEPKHPIQALQWKRRLASLYSITRANDR